MNRRLIGILLLIFGVLVVIRLLQLNPAPAPALTQQPAQPTAGSYAFLGLRISLQTTDIQAVRLREPASNKSFIINRSLDGTWTAPETQGRLDQSAASNIAKTVTLMPYSRTIPQAQQSKLSEYGFGDKGTLSVEVVSKDGKGHAFAVGNLLTSGLEYYVLVDNLPEVFIVDRRAVDYLLVQLRNPPLT
jgi:hypothetical protein